MDAAFLSTERNGHASFQPTQRVTAAMVAWT
jgi:hypothetical protein